MASLVKVRDEFEWRALIPALLGFVLLFLLLLIYAFKAGPDIYWGDSSEFVYIVKHGGIAHPSGYPLYTMISRLADALLPLPTAYSLSLLSSLLAATSILLLYILLLELGIDPLKAAMTGIFIGLSPVVVDQATVPEVYALHLLLQLAGIWLIVRWLKVEGLRVWIAAWLVFGLAFSNHLTSFWSLPAVFCLLWSQRKKLTALRWWLSALGAFLIGLTPYYYLILHAKNGVAYNQGDPSTLPALFSHLSGSVFRYRLFSLSAEEFMDQVVQWGTSLSDQWGSATLVLLPVGLVTCIRTLPRPVWLGAIAWLTVGCLYIWNYFIPDKDGYYLVLHSIIGLFIACGYGFLIERLVGKRAWARKWLFTVLLLAGALAPVFMSWDISRKNNTSLRDYTVDCWKNLDARTLMVSEDINLHYGTMLLQEEGLLPVDNVVISQYLLGFRWYHRFISIRYPSVYFSREFAALTDEFRRQGMRISGPELGHQRQILVERMTRDLIKANIAQRPIAILLLDDEDEPKRYGDFYLQNRGLVYSVHKSVVGGDKRVKCDFASKYLAGKNAFRDNRERYVASRYGTACNRLGIRMVADGEHEGALKAFQRALRYDPEYMQAMKNMGLVLIKYLRREEEGRQIWKRYVEMSGDQADRGVVGWLKNKH